MEEHSVAASRQHERPFRILSLDGGGIRGAFIAACLARLEKELGRPLIDYFDLLAGTSTGGLIAVALALGESAQKIAELYRVHGSRIFARRRALPVPLWARLCIRVATKWLPSLDVGWLRQTKYAQEELKSVLVEIFGDRTLEEAKCRVVIPSIDLTTGQTVVFKSAHQPGFIRDRHLSAVDVILATTAAPTYFPPATIHEGSTYIDGGLWANNPSMVGYVEAIKIREVCKRPGIDPEFEATNISMLSVGTGRARQFAKSTKDNTGIIWWAPRLLNIMGASQSQGTGFQMHYVLGERYYRIDFDIPDDSWKLDAVELLPELMHMGDQKAIEIFAKLKTCLFSTTVQPYTPFP